MNINKEDLAILMETHLTEKEAINYLKNGTVINEVSDYLKFFDELANGLEDEDKQTLKTFLENKKASSLWGNDLVEHEGKYYYIEYVL